MSIKALKEKARKKESTKAPEWAERHIVAGRMYRACQYLYKEKSKNLTNFRRSADLGLNKRSRNISKKEIAENAGYHYSSIRPSAPYYQMLVNEIDRINAKLQDKYDQIVQSKKRPNAKGLSSSRKATLLSDLQDLRKRYSDLESKNAAEQADYVLQILPLDLKRALGLKVT